MAGFRLRSDYRRNYTMGGSKRALSRYRRRNRGRGLGGRSGRYRKAGNYGRYTPPNAEMKFLDQIIDVADVSASGVIASSSICVIPNGTGESERIGRKLTIKKIQAKISLVLPSFSAFTSTTDLIRVILYHDKQCNGTALTNLSTLLANQTDLFSFRKLENSTRFNFIWDKTYALNSMISGDGTTTRTGGIQRFFHIFKECNIQIEYDNVNGTITEQKTNTIGLALITEAGLIDFESHWRIRYTDA